jgi:hypothetical protein
MDVPILVAIISVVGSLLGTVVGGSIVAGGNYFLAQRQENLQFRTACRLVAAELQDAQLTVNYALEKKLWWRPDEELTTEAWEQYKNVLAPHLPYDALVDVRLAVRAVHHASLLAAAPRPHDKTEEIFLEENANALTLFLKDIEKGRIGLMPYLL